MHCLAMHVSQFVTTWPFILLKNCQDPAHNHHDYLTVCILFYLYVALIFILIIRVRLSQIFRTSVMKISLIMEYFRVELWVLKTTSVSYYGYP